MTRVRKTAERNGKATSRGGRVQSSENPESLDERFRVEARASQGGSAEFGAPTQLTRNRSAPRRSFRESLVDLRISGRPVLPYVPQVALTDCGAAALAIVLEHHGVEFHLDSLRSALNVGRDGVSAKSIVEVARHYGLEGRGVRATLDGLKDLQSGTILYWNFNHFVVLEGFSGGYLRIVDPAYGRRRISATEASRAFTGIAIEFTVSVSADLARGVRNKTKYRHVRERVAHFFPLSTAWIATLGASAGILVLTLLLPYATGWLVSSSGSETAPSIGLLAGLVCIALIAYLLLQLLRGLAIAKLQSLSERKSTLKLFTLLLRLPYAYFERRHPSELSYRVRTSSRIRALLNSVTISAAFDVTLLIVFVIVIAVQNAAIGALVTAGLIFVIVIVIVSWKRQWYFASDYLEAQVRASNHLMEILEGMLTVKSAGAEMYLSSKWQNLFSLEISAGSRQRRNSAIFTAILSTIQFITPLCVLLLGYWEIHRGMASMAEVITFSTLSVSIFTPLASISLAIVQIASFGPDLERVGDVLDSEAALSSGLGLHTPLPSIGDIVVRNVSFTYSGGLEAALDNINLEILKGSYLGIVGRSGSGKSSLGLLLSGLYEPTSGQVLVSGVDLASVDGNSYRSTIGYVDQRARLFSGSIFDNLRIAGDDITDDEIFDACRSACIHEDIRSLPMGYETLLGVDGSGLSGGQRQRIVLARCLLNHPELMILDEATSAVDRETEHRIYQNIRTEGRTLVVISHRPSLFEHADQVIALSGGRVDGVDSHASNHNNVD